MKLEQKQALMRERQKVNPPRKARPASSLEKEQESFADAETLRSGHKMKLQGFEIDTSIHQGLQGSPFVACGGGPPVSPNLPPHYSELEPFVDAEAVAKFLSVPRPGVLKLTREGLIRGYPYRGRLRHFYRYRLSEVSQDFVALGNGAKMRKAATVSQRRKSNG
jgi:hypothetical protein